MKYEIRPLGPWIGPVTENRKTGAQFRSNWESTLKLLRSEAEWLDAGNLIIQVDANPSDIRLDGMLRVRAQVGFPGVRVSLDSMWGPLTYATDAYENWRKNVHAIALSMQALRAVDRYGVSTKGEQYRGWAAIEGNGDAAKRAAQDLIASYGGLADALKATHPDRGGNAADFQRVQEARRVLGL